ncbi:SpoIIE family protein phosphatase [Haliangium sp.]|uniref:SpoIIE family protein phosphatase n=1 Tax=Haliangium sp. TaxID=2663208 RepID=UPI003D1035FD
MSPPPPLVVPGEVAALPAIGEYVLDAARTAGLDRHAQYRLRLAVDEVATNIIVHGYEGTGCRGHISLSVDIDDDALAVCIEDTAPAYDPSATLATRVAHRPLGERDEGGLGLYLVACSVDQLSYERVGERNRNLLRVYRGDAARVRVATVHLLVAAGPEQRARVAAALAGGEYCLEEAGGCDEIITGLDRAPVELVLLGLDLPDGRGEDCLHRLRALRGAALPPVVLLYEPGPAGAEGGPERRPDARPEVRIEACRDSVVLDFLSLALPPGLLRASIGRLVEHARLGVELLQAHKRAVELEALRHDFTEVILPLGAALSQEADFDRLMERVVVEAMAICHADGGTLYLKSAGDELQFSIMRTRSLDIARGGLTGEPVPYAPLPLHDPRTGAPNHRNAATSAALRQRSINVPNVYDPAAGFDFSGAKDFDRALGYRTVSCLTVPLVAGGTLLGVLQMINAQDAVTGERIPFGPYQQQVIESLASQAAVAMHNHVLLHEREGLLKFEREMQIGREIQASFLPAELPRVPGWQIAAYVQPARMVSGDFYDAFALSGGCVGLTLADVCDKGVGAALFMGLIRSLLRAFAQTADQTLVPAPSPDEAAPPSAVDREDEVPRERELSALLARCVSLTNDYLARTHGELDMFATLFFAALMPSTGVLLYINCGHPPVLVAGAEGVRAYLEPTGPALGIIPGATFRVERVQIAPGEIVLGYTDGVLDARDPAAERFGQKRLEAQLSPVPASAKGLIERIGEVLRDHIGEAEVFDDVSVLSVLRERPEAGEGALQ